MFCASSDTLQSITEKTKLLAQKCTQQIRVQQCLSPSAKKDAPPLIGAGQQARDTVVTSTAAADQAAATASFKCFCPCKGPLNFKVLAKKQIGDGSAVVGCCKITATAPTTGSKESSTKWYVKVIQINEMNSICKYVYLKNGLIQMENEKIKKILLPFYF